MNEDGEINVDEDKVETKIKSYIKILLFIFWYGSLIFVAFRNCKRTDNKRDDYYKDYYRYRDFWHTNSEDFNTSKSKKTNGGGANKKSKTGSKTSRTGSKTGRTEVKVRGSGKN